uniref:OTU deubiquitinase with linear linkage specificity n=1 Tax=Latimeria chalumnae TaxID=7897 RepID=H2ZTU2_LATCH
FCSLRFTFHQAFSGKGEAEPCLHVPGATSIPEKLAKREDLMSQWRLRQSPEGEKENPVLKLKEYLELLKKKWADLCGIENAEERQAVCDKIFEDEEEEYCLYEAVKLLMFNMAINLNDEKEEGKDVPVFVWLLFARDTCTNPMELLKNHLNQVGNSGGLEQVEMFLLGYALQVTIHVYRLYRCETDEFITFYPDDHKEDWPQVTLLTEDDRHYNVPVGKREVTYL